MDFPKFIKYCNKCGKETSKIATSQIESKNSTCNKCKKINKMNSEFCSNCGNKLEEKAYEKINNLDEYYEDLNNFLLKNKLLSYIGMFGLLLILISGILIIKI